MGPFQSKDKGARMNCNKMKERRHQGKLSISPRLTPTIYFKLLTGIECRDFNIIWREKVQSFSFATGAVPVVGHLSKPSASLQGLYQLLAIYPRFQLRYRGCTSCWSVIQGFSLATRAVPSVGHLSKASVEL